MSDRHFLHRDAIESLASTTPRPHKLLTDEACTVLARDLEKKLIDIIMIASSIMKHANRRTMTTADVMIALRMKGINHLYSSFARSINNNNTLNNTNNNSTTPANDRINGVIDHSSSTSPSNPSSTSTPNNNNAASAPISITGGLPLQIVPKSSEDPSRLLYINDPIVSLQRLIDAPLPPPPSDSTFVIHWLAVDGVQPATVYNPPQKSTAIAASTNGATSGSMGGGGTGGGVSSAVSSQAFLAPSVAVKPLIRHVLSREQQVYYDHVTNAVLGSDENARRAAFKSVSADEGLSQLVPFFIQFITSNILQSLHQLSVLRNLLAMANALLISPHLTLEPYLHQLLPALITLIVSRTIGESSMDDHWTLRQWAADAVAFIVSKHAHAYPTLISRLSRVFLSAWLDVTMSLTTHYGCIIAMHKLGVVKALVLPYIRAYLALLTPALTDRENPLKRNEAMNVHAALLHSTGDYLHQTIADHARDIRLQKRIYDLIRNRSFPDGPRVSKTGVIMMGEEGEAEEESEIGDALRRSLGSSELKSESIVNEDIAMSVSELYDLFGEALLPYMHQIFSPQSRNLPHIFI